ncbi:DUF1684 domain-containing protein [Kitasatospora viridis]|uniref:DUF1684 domain-containing protein n=1 Tax=Kitasatospora viridis TaxID=281105 RepID=A0A561UA69_9ACTN|nr:DUF1684 domain-containing protein [Kitasatospora viridis]TWF96248.1 hypothetical protein FHX73_1112 [Kitasatospora viridis]
MSEQQGQHSEFVRQWEAWHAEHERVRTDPHGFLAVTSLNWLDAEPTRYPDAPGSWSSTAEGVTVELAVDEELVIDGSPVHGTHHFGVIEERAGFLVRAGEAVIEVAKRGGKDILRPRHPGNELLADYAGTAAYEPDPRWAVPARFVPFDAPRPVTVGAAVEGIQHVYQAPGQLEFELDGATHRLTAFNGGRPGTLQVLFTDATSGTTTYPANRSLAVPAPDDDQRVVLDFNRATNLPCAYTEHATCPLPPAENRLRVAVEAGERYPFERHGKEPHGKG